MMADVMGAGTIEQTGDGWLPVAAEADAYDGIRDGDEAAFRAVATPLQPALCRLAALTTGPGEPAAQLAARTWSVALGGLDMFRWQTPFATWVAGITVALGRVYSGAPVAPLGPPGSAHRADGPPDWSDLPWGARWQDAWPAVRSVLPSLPLPERETVHAGDVEQWPERRVCDVLGLPHVAYVRLLHAGRTRVCNRLADLIGEPCPAIYEPDRLAAVARMLRELLEPDAAPLDPRSLAAFQRWCDARRRGWRRVVHLVHRA